MGCTSVGSMGLSQGILPCLGGVWTAMNTYGLCPVPYGLAVLSVTHSAENRGVSGRLRASWGRQCAVGYGWSWAARSLAGITPAMSPVCVHTWTCVPSMVSLLITLPWSHAPTSHQRAFGPAVTCIVVHFSDKGRCQVCSMSTALKQGMCIFTCISHAGHSPPKQAILCGA